MCLKFWKKGNKFAPKKCCPAKWPKTIAWILFVILVVTAVSCVVLQKTGYVDVLKIAWQIKQQQQLSAEDKQVLAQLKNIMLLPENTTPTMAVITDIDALKKIQPTFFADAKNGERLIIYSDKAIIFDAANNKIIQVGPVQISQTATSQINFAIYNGTTDIKAETTFEKKLLSAYKDAQIKIRQTAAKTDYEKTIIIDLTGKNSTFVANLAATLKIDVASLPSGEKAPSGADVLVIIGKNS